MSRLALATSASTRHENAANPAMSVSGVILSNMQLMLKIAHYQDLATVIGTHKSTVSKWAAGNPIPLRYCTPFLFFVTYRSLSSVDGLSEMNIGRGHTNNPILAAKSPQAPGPVFINTRPQTDSILGRFRQILGHLPFGSDLAPDRNIHQWQHRSSVPDAAVFTVAKTTNAPIEWLLLGIDHDLGQQ